MKPQNLFAKLDSLLICSENILSYCEEIKEIEKGIVLYLKKKEIKEEEKGALMNIYRAKTEEELLLEIKKVIKKKKHEIRNISKFIDFMVKEGNFYYKIMESKEFEDWLDDETKIDDDFFEEIEFIPAYIEKHSGVMVLDMLKTFEGVMFLISKSIGKIIKKDFPLKHNAPQLIMVKNLLKREEIKLSKGEESKLFHFILSYEDFRLLFNVITNEIKELEQPINI